MLKQFITKRPQKKTRALIEILCGIVEAYNERGYSLTVRQAYYQCVARDYIPNNEKSYTTVINAIKDGRLMGLIDWDSIVDRTREPDFVSTWDNPAQLIRAAAKGYRRDWWEGQPNHIECWVEKQALGDIVRNAAHDYGVTAFACKGFSSLTTMYDASMRFKASPEKQCTILYMGDHDPAGLAMIDSIRKQMDMFEATVQVVPIGLTIQQIQLYNPPSNPAKEKDKNYKKYAAKYGERSWELDALPPEVLTRLIHDNIKSRLDQTLFKQAQDRQENERAHLLKLAQTIA